MTALGSVRAPGGRASLRTTIAFSQVVHASNSDEFELPDGSLLLSTANYDFILSKGQATTVQVTATLISTADLADAKVPELKFFYKSVAVACPATVC
jgi:hypothetical protein